MTANYLLVLCCIGKLQSICISSILHSAGSAKPSLWAADVGSAGGMRQDFDFGNRSVDGCDCLPPQNVLWALWLCRESFPTYTPALPRWKSRSCPCRYDDFPTDSAGKIQRLLPLSNWKSLEGRLLTKWTNKLYRMIATVCNRKLYSLVLSCTHPCKITAEKSGFSCFSDKIGFVFAFLVFYLFSIYLCRLFLYRWNPSGQSLHRKNRSLVRKNLRKVGILGLHLTERLLRR